jgi:hypothetical protein
MDGKLFFRGQTMKHTPAWIAEFLSIPIENARIIRGILDGDVDPMAIKDVQTWVNKCYNLPSRGEMKMEAFNTLMGGYGVEGFGDFGGNDSVDYVNTGDTYNPTIVLYNGRYFFETWGDRVEKLERQGLTF